MVVEFDGAANGEATSARADAHERANADPPDQTMVAGAFGHPRLWERMLGGATRDLLDRMRLPIMMSN
jgi:hypothetical protein